MTRNTDLDDKMHKDHPNQVQLDAGSIWKLTCTEENGKEGHAECKWRKDQNHLQRRSGNRRAWKHRAVHRETRMLKGHLPDGRARSAKRTTQIIQKLAQTTELPSVVWMSKTCRARRYHGEPEHDRGV